MTVFAIILILYATSSRKVCCDDSLLPVLSKLVEEGLALEQTGRPPSSESFSFPALRAHDLIESLERSRTKTIEDQLGDLLWKKIDLETKLREATESGFILKVFGLIKERVLLVKELYDAREKLIRAKLEIVDKKKQVARRIAESEEPVSFDLLMRTLSLIYGEDFSREVSDLKRKTIETFEKPFLRPVITISTPDGLPRNCSVVTAIYQNLRRQKNSVLKNNEFTVVTTVTGFTADRLHLGVDFYAVNYTEEETEAGSSEDEEGDLLFLRQVIEDQMSLTRARLQKQLEDLKGSSRKQRENPKDQQSDTADEIQNLEHKLAKKITEINFEKTEKQIKLIQKQLQRHQKFLLEFDEIEKHALAMQAHVTEKVHEEQQTILSEKLAEEKDGTTDKSRKAMRYKTNGSSAMMTSTVAEPELDEENFSNSPTFTERIDKTVSMIEYDRTSTVDGSLSERNTMGSAAVTDDFDNGATATYAASTMTVSTSVRGPIHVCEGNGSAADGVLPKFSEGSQNEPFATTVVPIVDSIKSSDVELEEVDQDRTQEPANETRNTPLEFDDADLEANSTDIANQMGKPGEGR